MAGMANSDSVEIILDIIMMGGKNTGKAVMRKKVLVPKCNFNSPCVLYWRRKKVGHELFLRVFELCNDSLKKEHEYGERGENGENHKENREIYNNNNSKGRITSSCL